MRYVPCLPTLVRVFIMNGCWIFSKCSYYIYWDYHVVFIIFFFLMWYITTIDLCILNHPCDPGMTPAWLGAWYFLCVIGLSLLIFYWDIMHLYSPKILAYNMAHMVKNLLAMRETQVRSLGWEDPLEKGMATHYSCLENSMDRRAWWATVHGVTKSWTGLSHSHFHFHS